jgi:hypothetical protein
MPLAERRGRGEGGAPHPVSSEEAKRCTAFPLTKTAALPTFSSHHKPRMSRLVNQHIRGKGETGGRRVRRGLRRAVASPGTCILHTTTQRLPLLNPDPPAHHLYTEAQTGQAPAGEIHVGRRPQETSLRRFLTSKFPPLPLVVVQPPPATCTCRLSQALGYLRQMPGAQAG